MRFWKRWIADFRGKTKGCSLAEVGAYDILLDEYYAHERALPEDPKALYRITGAIDQDERSAVDAVIAKFFMKGEDGLMHNKKADEVLAEEQRYSADQRARGKLGAQARKSSHGNGAWWKTRDGAIAMAEQMGVQTIRGEDLQPFVSRIFAAIKANKAEDQSRFQDDSQ